MTNKNNNTSSSLYKGGLSEIVDSPSSISFKYLCSWFNTNSSLGLALDILKLPYNKSNKSLLVLKDHELYVDSDLESDCLYGKTIFVLKQSSAIGKPLSNVNWKGITFPKVITTLKMIFEQSKWVGSTTYVESIIDHSLLSIPEKLSDHNLDNVERVMAMDVWPNVIVIDILCEYFSEIVSHKFGPNYMDLMTQITHDLAGSDWVLKSELDQRKVRAGEMDFADFIRRYGLRADNDYELSCPRWHEIKPVLENRIKKYPLTKSTNNHPGLFDKNLKNDQTVKTLKKLLIARSEAKRKALFIYDLLRQALLAEGMIENHVDWVEIERPKSSHNSAKNNPTGTGTGTGSPISTGEVVGYALHIDENSRQIEEGIIGIFKNASPKYSVFYPHCAGMVFLSGGMTSHGAIVAREYKIPAITDSNLASIENNTMLKINGKTGEWELL